MKFLMATVLVLALTTPLAAQPGPPPSLERLHDSLRLRPDQEQAWRSFEMASRPDQREEARRQDAFQRMGSIRAPQRMDLSLQMMRADLDQMEREADALKALYATLSPDQQETFDRETLPPPR
jgi:protein CpxP